MCDCVCVCLRKERKRDRDWQSHHADGTEIPVTGSNPISPQVSVHCTPKPQLSPAFSFSISLSLWVSENAAITHAAPCGYDDENATGSKIKCVYYYNYYL